MLMDVIYETVIAVASQVPTDQSMHCISLLPWILCRQLGVGEGSVVNIKLEVGVEAIC